MVGLGSIGAALSDANTRFWVGVILCLLAIFGSIGVFFLLVIAYVFFGA